MARAVWSPRGPGRHGLAWPQQGDRLAGGLFSLQPNNSTRQFEYPWAFYVAPFSRDLHVLEIGGGMSGLQFALAQAGAVLSNVDPFRDYGHGPYDAEPSLVHGKLNRYFRRNVTRYPCTLAEAKLASASFDRISCISTIEHLEWQELCRTVKAAFSLLREGGLFVSTIDLCLNLVSFTRRERNEFGVNVPVRELIAETGADLLKWTRRSSGRMSSSLLVSTRMV